jgi:hypothetical protein
METLRDLRAGEGSLVCLLQGLIERTATLELRDDLAVTGRILDVDAAMKFQQQSKEQQKEKGHSFFSSYISSFLPSFSSSCSEFQSGRFSHIISHTLDCAFSSVTVGAASVRRGSRAAAPTLTYDELFIRGARIRYVIVSEPSSRRFPASSFYLPL